MTFKKKSLKENLIEYFFLAYVNNYVFKIISLLFNQKVIYAKVLDVIPDITQNKGIFLRLSKAGAEELGATEEQFDAIVSY